MRAHNRADTTCAMGRVAGLSCFWTSARLLVLISLAMLFCGASAPAHAADPKEWTFQS